jgi:hypothetical protein
MLTFEEWVLCGNPLQRFGSELEPDPEPTQEFGPVGNTRNEQGLEVGALELDLDDNFEPIQISVLDVEQLLAEAKETIEQKAMLDDKYRDVCK